MNEIEDIDFTESTDIIVPISNMEGTNVKRKFHVLSVPTGLDTKIMKVQGIVKHYIDTTIDVAGTPTVVEVPYTAGKDYPYELVADENVRVNKDGSFNPEGEIGEYTWIRLVEKNGFLTTDQIIVGAILRQDALGLIKPR